MTEHQERGDKVIYPVRLDRQVYEQVRRRAASEDLNTAQFVRRAIRRELREIEAQGRDSE